MLQRDGGWPATSCMVLLACMPSVSGGATLKLPLCIFIVGGLGILAYSFPRPFGSLVAVFERLVQYAAAYAEDNALDGRWRQAICSIA